MNQGQVRAGVAELEMHPDIGLATEDGAPIATGFLTPLYVKALVLSTGHDDVALVTLDLMGIDRADGLRAAAVTSDRSGIPAQNIVLMCSHTHAAPSMMSTLHVYREVSNPDWDDAAKKRERDWVTS